MATFRTHISFGILWAILISAGSFLYGGISILQAVIVFTLAVIGAGIPDIDSDSSQPVHILFGILGVVCPVLLYKFFIGENATTEAIFLCILGLYLFIRHILAEIFFRFTRHRGIYHSIPAALISGELIFLLFKDSAVIVKCFLALAIAGGYLSHLILDEIYSVDVLGLRIKKSSGTALTLRSESKFVTLIAYVIVFVLGYFCFVSI